jgi:lysyl-tRNA synthetase class 1
MARQKNMTEKIIGHGTWYDKTAFEIVKRERKLGRSLSMVRTEMGLGASGIPHVGNVSDGIRSHAVTVALQAQGYGSELIAFCDDKDGLRKVPAGFPQALKKYLGFPVRMVPDPYGCHKSFGEHSNSLLLEAFDKCGVKYKFMSATEIYEKGLLNKEIETILQNAQRVGEIIREEVGQEKFEEALPYFAICSNCGRIYTTRAYKFLPKEHKVLYTCEGMEIKGQQFEGCGHQGEANYTRGEGKLVWKVEFAARWRALDIRFEAFGKDIADSVRVNDRICQEILNYPAPYHAKYELFLAKGGKRFSKSAGTVFTPQVWFRYGSPQSLNLLMLKRFVGTRAISVMDIPRYMNEFDELEDIYFGEKKVENKKELAKLQGLYEYLWWLKPPSQSSVHVLYNLLVYLAKVAPKESESRYITEKLKEYQFLEEKKGLTSNLEERIRYAFNWTQDFGEISERTIKLGSEERQAIEELMQIMQTEMDADQVQGAVFNLARKYNIQPGQFFRTLYTILLGTPTGPRLGPYLVAMGRKNVLDALERALGK